MLVSDQVAACDESAEIDISPIVVKCGSTEKSYKIISSKNVTGIPTITATKITFTPADNNYASAEIIYKVSCGILSAIGKIVIVYKNNCVGVDCDSSERCNKCSGECVDIEGSLSVDVGSIIGINGGLTTI